MPDDATTILICDDEPSLRELMRISLPAAYSFAEAADAAEAIELVDQVRPDLVLLDVMMPGASGLTVIEWLRGDAELSDTPVLVISAFAADSDRLAALDAGATGLPQEAVRPRGARVPRRGAACRAQLRWGADRGTSDECSPEARSAARAHDGLTVTAQPRDRRQRLPLDSGRRHLHDPPDRDVRPAELDERAGAVEEPHGSHTRPREGRERSRGEPAVVRDQQRRRALSELVAPGARGSAGGDRDSGEAERERARARPSGRAAVDADPRLRHRVRAAVDRDRPREPGGGPVPGGHEGGPLPDQDDPQPSLATARRRGQARVGGRRSGEGRGRPGRADRRRRTRCNRRIAAAVRDLPRAWDRPPRAHGRGGCEPGGGR